MNFYIADTHFGHENIIRLSNRPFKNIDEMDKTIIDNWNSKVKESDNVYILGDFVFKNKMSFEYYLKQLKGKKHLIIGNHDLKLLNNNGFKKYFESINDVLTVRDGNQAIVLCHYPMIEWNGYYRGWKHFYGHIHNNKNEAYEVMKDKENAFNVGADILNFYPCTLEEILKTKKAD